MSEQKEQFLQNNTSANASDTLLGEADTLLHGSFNLQKVSERLHNFLKTHPRQADDVLNKLFEVQELYRPMTRYPGGEAGFFECFRSVLQTEPALAEAALVGSVDRLNSKHCHMRDLAALQIDYIIDHHHQLAPTAREALLTHICQTDEAVSFETYEALTSIVAADPASATDVLRQMPMIVSKDPTPKDNINAIYDLLKHIADTEPKHKDESVRFFKDVLKQNFKTLSSWDKCMIAMLDKPRD